MKNARRLMLVVCLLLLVGCGDSDTTDGSGGANLDDAGKAWVKTMSDAIAAQSGQLDQLKKQATDNADAELKKLLEQLDTKLAAAQAKLKEIQDSSGDTFEKLKKELEPIMADMTKLYTEAMAKASGMMPDGLKLP